MQQSVGCRAQTENPITSSHFVFHRHFFAFADVHTDCILFEGGENALRRLIRRYMQDKDGQRRWGGMACQRAAARRRRSRDENEMLECDSENESEVNCRYCVGVLNDTSCEPHEFIAFTAATNEQVHSLIQYLTLTSFSTGEN